MISLIQTGELILRKTPFDLPVLISLFVSIFLIGLAKISHQKTLETAFGTLFSMKTEISFNDSVKMHPVGSFALIINFLIGMALITFLSTKSLILDTTTHYLFSIGISLLLLLIHLTGIYIVGFISGALGRIQINQIFTINFLHIAGIIACIISIPWIINPQLSNSFTILAMVSLGALYIWRLLKILSVALREKIPFYYLILYLCTLEIFPVYFSVAVFWKNFNV